MIVAYLREHCCVDCGEDDIRVLDFDHLPGVAKRASVVAMALDGLSWSAVAEEMGKCRCANCHRRRTAERAGTYRQQVHVEEDSPEESPASARLAVLLGRSSG